MQALVEVLQACLSEFALFVSVVKFGHVLFVLVEIAPVDKPLVQYVA